MGKIAFLFAGQGAQYPGMGQSLVSVSPQAKEFFEEMDRIRPGTSAQCFAGTAQELARTCNTQPCVFAVDLAAALALTEAGVVPQGVAGFSLGELAALTFAGAFSRQQGGRLVCHRAALMEQAARETPSAMAAVLKCTAQQVEAICAGHPGVWAVNYNCPGQTVVAGPSELLPAFCEAVAAAGGRSKILPVGGGFHSPCMTSAAEGFARLLEESPMEQPALPVYSNRNAAPYEGADRATLAGQIDHPVRWQETLEKMWEDGYTTFIEVGPGKTLSGFVRRTLSQAVSLQVEDADSLQATLSALGK